MKLELEEIKASVVKMLPGYLALFNFADTKRRNDYFGHQKVDQEIEQFTESLSLSVDYELRISGAKWLGFFNHSSMILMQKLLEDFYQEESILIGWTSSGQKDGITKSHDGKIEATVVRAMRCIYSYIEKSDSLELVIEKLLENDYGLPVNIPHEIKEVLLLPLTRERWSCISQYPTRTCPFCEGKSYGWLHRDARKYYDYGCRDCGAEFKFLDELSDVF